MRHLRRGPAVHGLALVALMMGMLSVGACASPAGSPIPATATPSAPASEASDPPTASASVAPTGFGATFPPSQTAIEPGTYRWDGFERPLAVTLDAGWELGHDDPAFFDLFRGSDFPSISFARFTDVYADASTRNEATDAASVTSALSERIDMTVTEPIVIELGGLAGRQFDVVTTAPKTPVFFGPAGDFRLEPEFKTRYRVLDFSGGGVLVIGIHAPADEFDAALALANPVLSTLQVEPANP